MSFRPPIIPVASLQFLPNWSNLFWHLTLLTGALPTEPHTVKLLHVSYAWHSSLYVPLQCIFFRHSMFLTHVQTVIQIPLVLGGRTAVKFTLPNHVFVQLTTPDEYGAFAFLLLNCILWYTYKTDELVLLLLYILLISFLQCLHPSCFSFTRFWVATWNILKVWKACSALL